MGYNDGLRGWIRNGSYEQNNSWLNLCIVVILQISAFPTCIRSRDGGGGGSN